MSTRNPTTAGTRRLTAATLLTMPVVDRHGRSLGLVRDVRLVRGDDGIVATGLVVGRRMLSERLGYASGSIEGPWVLTAWLQRRHSHLRWVPWEVVSDLGTTDVRLSVNGDELDPVLEVRR